MRRFLTLIAAVGISIGVGFGITNTAHAQRSFGARTFVMDDGAGHTYTMMTPTGMTGNITYQFPTPPPGNPPAGFVNIGTVTGQTLFWNNAAGHLDWEASNVLTNDGVSAVGVNGTLGVTGLSTLVAINSTGNANIATANGTSNSFGSGGNTTTNIIGSSASSNAFGVNAVNNNFGTQSGAVAMTNNFGNANAGASTVANNFGTAIVGTTMTNTIGSVGGPVTNTILGTTNINSTGGSTTNIGSGGSGAVNIGNATGNTVFTGGISSNGSTNVTNGGGDGETSGSLNWDVNAPGYAVGVLNTGGSVNSDGLIAKTTGTAATNKIFTANSGGTDRFSVNGDGSITAPGAFNGGAGSFTNLSASGTLGVTGAATFSSTGSFGGALNMNSNLINNVTDPTSAQDAATKHYVDVTALGTAVILAPATTARNTVTPTADVVPLTLKNFAGGTADILDLKDGSGNSIASFSPGLTGLTLGNSTGVNKQGILRLENSGGTAVYTIAPSGTIMDVNTDLQADGNINANTGALETAGTTRISNTGAATLTSINGSGAITFSGIGGLGVVHSSGVGALSSSLIATGDIGAGAVNLGTQVTGVLPVANGGTGSNTQNFVDLSTGQTVNGNKTFTGTTGLAVTNVVGTANINTSGTAATNVGNTTGNIGLTGANIFQNGAVQINSSGAGTTSLNGGTSTGSVTLGNAGNTTNLTSGTTNLTGIANINNSGSAATNVGSGSGNTVVGNGTGTTSITGSTWSISNGGGAAFTALGSTGNSNIGTGLSLANAFGNGGGATTNNIGNNNVNAAQTTINNIGQATTAAGSANTNIGGGVGTTNVNLGGAVSVTGFSTSGIVHNNASGLLSTNAVNLASNGAGGDVTGVLAVANGGTGSNTQNFVDLTTSQTVSGNKTFKGAMTLGANGAGGVQGVLNLQDGANPGTTVQVVNNAGTLQNNTSVNLGQVTGATNYFGGGASTNTFGSNTTPAGLTTNNFGDETNVGGNASVVNNIGQTVPATSQNATNNIGTPVRSVNNILGATNINSTAGAVDATQIGTVGTGGVTIGNTSAGTSINSQITNITSTSANNIHGTTFINNAVADNGASTTIGSATNTGTQRMDASFVNLNNLGGSGVTNIGSSTAGNVVVASGGTISATGATSINTSGSATTGIGTGGTGAVTIGNTSGGTRITGTLANTATNVLDAGAPTGENTGSLIWEQPSGGGYVAGIQGSGSAANTDGLIVKLSSVSAASNRILDLNSSGVDQFIVAADGSVTAAGAVSTGSLNSGSGTIQTTGSVKAGTLNGAAASAYSQGASNGSVAVTTYAGNVSLFTGSTSVTLTNANITANSVVMPVMESPSTMYTCYVSAIASGTTTIQFSAGVAAGTSVGYIIVNP